ncbi:MAG: UDP-N-acetylmuramoyl-tripeptide--D-alanyl-D-alanine ligase [Kiritimatiellia bacterium]
MRWTLDSRAVRPGMGFVALKGEQTDGRAFIGSARAAGAADVIEGLEELQARARDRRRRLRATVVGVTGSAGKTTTKELLRAFLSRLGATSATEGNFNNHIGLPLSVLNCPDDAEFLVLEMGTSRPGEIAALCDIAAPDVGVLTNVGTAHLEGFGTQAGIAAEKGELLRRAPLGFSAADNPFCPGTVDTHQAWLRSALAGVLPGEHNVANACLAFAVAAHFGLTREQAVAALAGFALPGARWRRVVRDGVAYVDDSYNANPDSMVAALDAFAALPCAGRRIAALGDMFELGPDALAYHRQVFDHARALGIPLVVGVGELSSQCCRPACADAAALRGFLRANVSPGDLVLLKASHGMRLGSVLD